MEGYDGIRVLHVVEGYRQGGLERCIEVLCNELGRENSYIAVGSCDSVSSIPLPEQHIFTDFGFASNIGQSIDSFIVDVRRLQEIIEDNQIDYVLAHPYYSLYASAAAAKLSRVPVSYVVHGPGSITFPWIPTEKALFEYCIGESVEHVFTVSREIIREKRDLNGRVSLLRNPFPQSLRASAGKPPLDADRRWALVSRLDGDKLGGILSFISWLPHLSIDVVDVFGTGDSEEALLRHARHAGVEERLVFHGHVDSWWEHLPERTLGVVGLGRVAIEGLALGMPVILLSQDENPCGMIDEAVLSASVDMNFATRNLRRMAAPIELESQLEKLHANRGQYVFADVVGSLFSPEAVSRELVKQLRALVPIPDTGWRDFISFLEEGENDKGVSLYQSPVTAGLIMRCFLHRCASASSHGSIIGADAEARVRSDLSKANERCDEIWSRLSGEFGQVHLALGQSDDAIKRMESEAAGTAEEMRAVRDSIKMIEDDSASLRLAIDALADEMASLSKATEEAYALLAAEREENRNLRSSNSWRIGRAATAFPRWVKRVLRRKRR